MNVNDGIKLAFQIGCFMLAGYMAYQQFQLYVSNNDTSSVSYRKFNSGPQDLYPTFTVCLHSYHGGIFRTDQFLDMDEHANSIVYNHVLLGKCCKNQTIIAKAAALNFDEMLDFDIRDFVKLKVTVTR